MQQLYTNPQSYTCSDELEQWLKTKCYTSEGPYLRPFAPNVHWNKAEVFIVGLNPATPFRHEFESYEHYWRALTNNPKEYQLAYRNKYQKQEEEKSRTSRRISELLNFLKPINVLVTNVYAYPSANPKQIPREVRREPVCERILPHLFSVCKPKAIFFHGREARLFGSKFFEVSLDPYLAPREQAWEGVIPGATSPSSLFVYHHFVGRVMTKTVVDSHMQDFSTRIKARIASHGRNAHNREFKSSEG
jgi:hypothetical protein